jgi:hypothetical protein
VSAYTKAIVLASRSSASGRRIRTRVVQGTHRGEDFFAQIRRELIGPAEGIGHGGMETPTRHATSLRVPRALRESFMAAERRKASRKAAQSLRVSHPSLCEQIIDLETEIGTRLCERTNHHVSLKIILVDRAQALFTLIGAEFGVGLLSPWHFGAPLVGVSFRKHAESFADFPLSLEWNQQRGGPLVSDFLTMARQVLAKQEGILRLPTPSPAVTSEVLA